MLHRISIDGEAIHGIYRARQLGLSYDYEALINYLDTQLNNKYLLGSLKEAILDSQIIHLTFDDGYVEHLEVARRLKERYNLRRQDITFAINVRNSTKDLKICTDWFYLMMHDNKAETLIELLYQSGYSKSLTTNDLTSSFEDIKSFIFRKNITEIKQFYKALSKVIKLSNHPPFFLNEYQVLELSKLFSIASHSINHIYLNNLKDKDALYEIAQSKLELEKIIKQSVDVFCYPDGINTKRLQGLCQQTGYKYALSIKQDAQKHNPYCIPRFAGIET